MNIRASSLDIAQHCPGAPALLAAHPTERADLSEGTLVHGWLHHRLGGGPLPPEPEPEGISWEWLETLAAEHWIAWQDGCFEGALEMEIAPGVTLTGHVDWLYRPATGPVMVADWKHGAGQRWIQAPIADWLQGLAYAVLASQGRDVQLARVRLSDQEVDRIELDTGALAQARERIQAVCACVAAAPDHRTPGPHCEHCLAREHCAEYQELANHWLALPVPPTGVLSLQQALRWAVAREAIQDLSDAADAALRAYLAAGGVIEWQGQQLTLSGGARDYVRSPRACADALAEIVGRDLAETIIEVKETATKARIETLLKQAGQTPAERKAALDQLREAGHIEQKPVIPALKWRRT